MAMARPMRLEFPGALYHVMARGNDRRRIFADGEDYGRFVGLLGRVSARYGFVLHAYALMPNHYHLLVQTPQGRLSAGMQYLGFRYGQTLNRRHGRTGHVFQGRYKGLLVERGRYMVRLSRYIHRNPVAAALARRPWDYAWSSCRSFLGLEPAPQWLDTQTTLALFGVSADRQMETYRSFLERESEDDPLREAAGQLVLGTEAFVESMRPSLAPRAQGCIEYSGRAMWVKPARFQAQSVWQALRAVLAEEGPVGEAALPPRIKPAALYLMREWAHLPLPEIGQCVGLSGSGVCQAVRRFESRLEKDAELARLFGRLRDKVAATLANMSSVKT